jgi:hypothetical protein
VQLDVDFPIVDSNLDASQRGDAIDDQQGVSLVCTERRDIGTNSCRGLGISDSDH